MFIPVVVVRMLRTPRLPLALRLREELGVVSMSEKSKVAGALAGAGGFGGTGGCSVCIGGTERARVRVRASFGCIDEGVGFLKMFFSSSAARICRRGACSSGGAGGGVELARDRVCFGCVDDDLKFL